MLHSLRDAAPPAPMLRQPFSTAQSVHFSPAWLYGVLALLFAAIGGLVVWGVVRSEAPAPSPEPISTGSPPSGAVLPPGWLVASGHVVARNSATVAAEVTGRVVEDRVREGETVQRGQILAILDNSLAQSEHLAARSELAASEARAQSAAVDLADAQVVLDRSRRLAAAGFITNATLTGDEARRARAEALHQGALAQRATAEHGLERSRAELRRHVIRAPFSGIVINKSAQAGEIISPISAGGGFTRTGLCTIVDMDSLEILVDVEESLIGRIRAGQRVVAVLDALPETELIAEVIAIVPVVSRDKATIPVRIRLLNPSRDILPNMAVKVAFNPASPA